MKDKILKILTMFLVFVCSLSIFNNKVYAEERQISWIRCWYELDRSAYDATFSNTDNIDIKLEVYADETGEVIVKPEYLNNPDDIDEAELMQDIDPDGWFANIEHIDTLEYNDFVDVPVGGDTPPDLVSEFGSILPREVLLCPAQIHVMGDYNTGIYSVYKEILPQHQNDKQYWRAELILKEINYEKCDIYGESDRYKVEGAKCHTTYDKTNPEIIWDDDKPGEIGPGDAFNSCSDIFAENSKTFKILQDAFKAIMIVAPIIVIVLSILDFIKASAASDEKTIKDAQSKFIKRLIICVILFFSPNILTILFNLLGNTFGICGIA